MKQDKKTIKTYFETGDKPTQEQFEDLIDSYVDSKQDEGEANRRFIINAAGEVNLTSEQKIPEYTLSEISGNKLALIKDGVTVKEIDLTPYIDDTNLARLVSGTLDTNGIATFTRDNNSTFTIDLSNLKDNLSLQEITDKGNITTQNIITQGYTSTGKRDESDVVVKIGDYDDKGNGTKLIIDDDRGVTTLNSSKINILGDLIIDPQNSVTNIAGSYLTVKKESTEKGINTSQFVDVKRTGTIPNTSNTIAGVFRSTNSSSVNVDGTTGMNIVGVYDGTGGGNYVYGAITTATHKGSGNINFLIPHSDKAKVEGTGIATIDYVRGHSPSVILNNPNATINYAQGIHPNVTVNAGTVTQDVNVMFLDIDVDTANAANINIQGNMTYIRGGGGSDIEAASVGGKKRFIWNEGATESDFNGVINVLNPVADITNATNKVLITKEYADQEYKTKTIDTSTPQTSITLNTSHPIASNPIGTSVLNTNSSQQFMYVRISSNAWKAIALGADI
ncbi:hypothetical protein [Tenacibaculum halocynthiae]|uniref:hypothetical protein n=1 Tax=Tenacibaculum halocynthiae TaxID=1254437 RepID=UPI003895CFCA